jgi:hypothetical protein
LSRSFRAYLVFDQKSRRVYGSELQRVGIDFRLPFKLVPDGIQVIDLIPRQDLERKIKTIK